jgi:hypothetical protein
MSNDVMDNHSMIFVTIGNLVSPLTIPFAGRRMALQVINYSRLINLACQAQSNVVFAIKQIQLTGRRAPVAGKLLFQQPQGM